jgi:hypothetical protein
MSITAWILTYLTIGIVWSWGTNSYSREPTSHHDFVLSMATWPIEVGLLLISYIPMVWEEVQDQYEQWRAKNNK